MEDCVTQTLISKNVCLLEIDTLICQPFIIPINFETAANNTHVLYQPETEINCELEILGPSGARLLAGGPLGLLDFVLCALQALRPCDPGPHPSQAITIF